MILILNSNISEQSPEYRQLPVRLVTLQGIHAYVLVECGVEQMLDGIF